MSTDSSAMALRLLFAASALAGCYPALGGESGSSGEKPYPERMEFSEFQPCRGSGSFCATRILARGEIDEEAPKRLAAALDQLGHRTTIAFDSPGGSLAAGLAMGTLIRKRGIDTLVGSTYEEEVLTTGKLDSVMQAVATDAVCLSACAYAFMGGVSRTLEEGGKLGVHQFYGGKGNIESSAQVTTAVISQYMLAMGIDREVQDVAGLTESSKIAVLSMDDAVGYNLDNQHPPLASWELKALDDGDTVISVAQQQAGSDRVSKIVIGYEGDRELLVAVFYGPLGHTNDDWVGKALESVDVKPSFCVEYTHCVYAEEPIRWRYNRKTKLISGLLRIDASTFIRTVASPGAFAFNADLPNVYSSLEADVDLGRTGLRSALLAILK